MKMNISKLLCLFLWNRESIIKSMPSSPIFKTLLLVHYIPAILLALDKKPCPQ